MKIKYGVSNLHFFSFCFTFFLSSLHFPCMTLGFVRKMSTVLSPASPFKLALIQLGQTGADKTKNLKHAREKILEAAKQGANVVVLPVSYSYISRKRRKRKLTIVLSYRNASIHLMEPNISQRMPRVWMVVNQLPCCPKLPR